MKKKILFLIHTLGGGGAEKALVNLVNHLDTEKYDIMVETIFSDGVNAKNLNSNIHYKCKKMPAPKGVSLFFKLIPASILCRYIIGTNDYDLIIAYMHGIPVKVISGEKKAKKIAWLHNGNPETSTMFTSWLSLESAIQAYDMCDAVVGVCKSVADAFSRYTGISNKVRVVYNTLDTNNILAQGRNDIPFTIDKKKVNLVSTGRLGKEKGYSRLIEICSEFKREGYCFRLYLIGSGMEEAALKSQVHQLSLEDEVVFLGYQENPYQYVDKCDLFVCSSYTEGLSTATIEALILGKAIISTDVSGAREILGDSEYGIIVDNSKDALKSGIKLFLDNPKRIREFERLAKKRREVFDLKWTVKQAESLFDEILVS